MSPIESWVFVIAACGAVLLAVLAADALLDHHLRVKRSRARHPSGRPRHTCDLCGDPNVLHMPMHRHLVHGIPRHPEDREDWA